MEMNAKPVFLSQYHPEKNAFEIWNETYDRYIYTGDKEKTIRPDGEIA